MQKYLCQHVVEATPMTCGEWELATGHKWNEPDRPRTDLGYKCNYPDGYSGWCPKDAFEKVSRKIDGMTFGMALEILKRGGKVARKGWNGKGMWLWIEGEERVTPRDGKTICSSALHDIAEVVDDGVVVLPPVICMRTADKKALRGWLASQTDMLSEDWVEVI